MRGTKAKSEPLKYSKTLITLHWLLAPIFLIMLTVGWYMVSIADQPNSGTFFFLHRSFGLIVAVLVLFKLGDRLAQTSPPLPTSVPRWQAVAARSIHWLLYLCMIAMPLTGILGSIYGKHGLIFFNYHFPRLVAQNHYLHEQFFTFHSLIAWTFAILIALHILAAMKHLIINRDRVFQRMWF